MRLEFETYNQCVNYLLENFYKKDFLDNHTRKELAYILRIIESHALKQSKYAFRSMCKKRMCMHIDFYLRIHARTVIRHRKLWN